MKKIIVPNTCPSCDSVLKWKNDVLYCLNENCESRTHKLIEHWAKTLKIKGLGPKAIEKLKLNSIVDIYNLDLDFMTKALGSEKIAKKIYFEIEQSKKAPLNKVLPAFGIPLIGNTATEKLNNVLVSLNDLTEEKAKQAGLGPKATENLLNWFDTKYKTFYKESLNFSYNFKQKETNKNKKGIVCITGKLKTFKNKAEAKERLTKAGYIVSSSLTKKVTVLINESGKESAKTQKARESGLTIVTNINELTGE
jgi:DNA ligase (NAD+)